MVRGRIASGSAQRTIVGAVIRELDPHSRAEDAGRDLDPERAQGLAEALVERLGLLRRSRTDEARPVPLGRVRKERELAHDESGAAHVQEAPVEAALVVLEDAHACDLARQPLGAGPVVAAGHPEEDAEARADLAAHSPIDNNARPGDTLDDRSHRRLCAATGLASVLEGSGSSRAMASRPGTSLEE